MPTTISNLRSKMGKQREMQTIEAFGIFGCGVIGCAMVGGPLMARLELIPGAAAVTAMSYESMVTIMLAVAAIVVGIVLPLAALFGFVLLRGDVRFKVEEVIKNEIKEGRIQKQIDDAVSPLLANAENVLNARIDEIIEKAQRSKSTTPIIDWGIEEDEYGEFPAAKRIKLPRANRRKKT